MLDGAFTSPKIRRLAAILDVPWPHALGLAGLLWRFCAKHAPTGEIGRHDDEEIAAALEWPKTSGELIDGLVRCRLLDAVSGPARLIVHDWPDHAPRYVLATLKRKGLDYSPHYREQEEKTVDATAVETIEATSYTSTSTSTSALTFTPTSTLAKTAQAPSLSMGQMAEGIWQQWVPGRKVGKAEALKAIEKSIRSLAKSEGVSLEEAALYIAQKTRQHAKDYQDRIRAKETELCFVPQGVTYFRKERWLDDDSAKPKPTASERADEDLARIRAS